MVRVRRCALVAASASRLVPLSETVNRRSPHPNSMTLRLNRSQSQTTTRTRNLYQIEKRRMHLMTWQKQHTRAIIIVSRTAEEAVVRETQKKGVGGVMNEKITPTYRFARFVARSVFSFSLCFSFASRIRFAVPLLSMRKKRKKNNLSIVRAKKRAEKGQRTCS